MYRTSVKVKDLEHCLLCREPMWLIFKRPDGKRTRECCWECEQGMEATKTLTSVLALKAVSRG